MKRTSRQQGGTGPARIHERLTSCPYILAICRDGRLAAPLALCSRTQSALSLGLAAAAAAASCKHEQLSLPLNRHQASPLPRVPPRNTSRRFMPKARLSTLTRMVAAHQINFSTPRKSTNEYKFTHRIASVHTYRGDCKHSVAQTVGDALASIYTFVWNRMRAGYTASERRLLREERTGGTSAAMSGLHSPRAPSYKVQIELPAAARSSGRIAAAVLVRMRRDARLHGPRSHAPQPTRMLSRPVPRTVS